MFHGHVRSAAQTGVGNAQVDHRQPGSKKWRLLPGPRRRKISGNDQKFRHKPVIKNIVFPPFSSMRSAGPDGKPDDTGGTPVRNYIINDVFVKKSMPR
jgi:hypothetical protein